MDEKISDAIGAHFNDYRQRLQNGATRLGFKVAFNPPAVQQKLGLPHSLVAGLTTATREMQREHALEGSAAPALEAEVCVRLGGPIAPSDAPSTVLASVAAVAPAIEVVDYDRPLDQLTDVIREGVYHRAVAFGPEREPDGEPSLAGMRARITHNRECVADVDAEEATGHLPDLLLHIARVLEPFDLRLEAGDRLILGSMHSPALVAPGDRFALELSGVGNLELAFR
ncbi:MAG: fumarylacetoacetate hydrolase family protein [Myxococcales bacterium]|nr:fumarylacetoacetate hydrolase family protein [Myxococcales bacterium]